MPVVASLALLATLGVVSAGVVTGQQEPAAGPAPEESSAPGAVSGALAEPDAADGSTLAVAPRPKLVPLAVPQSGPGTFRVAKRSQPVALGTTTVRIEVEDGLRHDPDAVADKVIRTLQDPRGWSSALGTRFVQVVDDPDLRIVLATPATTDALCAPLQTNGKVSCRNGDVVVLNAWRWEVGTDDYAGRLADYRTYLVNHEVGHYLGQGHVSCPGRGRPAPVMQQQTYGLNGCVINVWPS